jgi:hypothetical protein
MKRLFLFITLFFVGGILLAQPHGAENPATQNHIPEIFQKLGIEQDPELIRLVGMHIRKNESVKGINGFRVEIFFSSALDARQKALQTKTAFLKDYPDINAYDIYVSPDWKVRVGDFRTKSEALYMIKKIQDRFPKAFLVPDLINYPNLN